MLSGLKSCLLISLGLGQRSTDLALVQHIRGSFRAALTLGLTGFAGGLALSQTGCLLTTLPGTPLG